MQKSVLFILCLFVYQFSISQGKTQSLPSDPTKWSVADMKRFAAMSPTEQEAFKKKMLQQAEGQLKQKAEAANLTIDETLLPTSQIKAPVLDMKRIATIPAAPPTRQQLLQNVAKMESALKTAVGPQVTQKVEEFVASKSIKEIQSAAVGGFYDNKPESALLLGMKAATINPADPVGWNNLAAIMNLSGLEHQAVPILQHCLTEHPESGTLLNNIGQAWLGLGDLVKSKQFLQKCLTLDDLHPEANRSMALIYLFGNDMASALKHLEKEMQVAQRKSSLAYLVKSGQRDKINLAALHKRKMQLNGAPTRDFFSEIALEKFKIPPPPENSKATAAWKAEHAGLLQSLSQEFFFWTNASQPSAAEMEAEGKKHFGIYHDLVEELIRDLGDQYIPLLAIIQEDDVPYLTQLQYDYSKKDRETVCPDPPKNPDNISSNFAAAERICCDLKTPLIDELMYKHNSFVSAKIKDAQSNYKQFLNGLINIVQLDPSLSNRMMVYKAVADYFVFLQTAIGSYLVLDPYMSCHTKMTSEEAKDAYESARNIDLQCPSWLKINLSLKVAKLKADCEGYNVEADVYKLIQVGAEKKFKTGTSTLYVGAGISGSFKNVASGSIKQQFYIVFDHNNDFADLGMRGGASGDLASGMIGAEFGYDFSMNSGFNAQGKVTSKWVTNYEKALGMVAK